VLARPYSGLSLYRTKPRPIPFRSPRATARGGRRHLRRTNVSLERLTRLEDIARRRRPERPFIDPFDACMRLLVDLRAVHAGRACWIPRPERELSEEAQQVFELRMCEADGCTNDLRPTKPRSAGPPVRRSASRHEAKPAPTATAGARQAGFRANVRSRAVAFPFRGRAQARLPPKPPNLVRESGR
jgi:hypothetical protein